jgi:hypothetical protein
MLRALEPPTIDEGFDAIETVPFERFTPRGERVPGIAIALEKTVDSRSIDEAAARLPTSAPVLVLAWQPEAGDEQRTCARSIVDELERRLGRAIDLAICAHPGGPPTCWCRPPLPGLWIEFAERRGVRAEGSVLVGGAPAHATMARALGLELVG